MSVHSHGLLSSALATAPPSIRPSCVMPTTAARGSVRLLGSLMARITTKGTPAAAATRATTWLSMSAALAWVCARSASFSAGRISGRSTPAIAPPSTRISSPSLSLSRTCASTAV